MTKKSKKIDVDKFIEDSTDEECLALISKFFDRVDIGAKFIEDEEGLITHQLLVLQCGDKVIVSDPDEFAWPLQRLPMPQALQGSLN